MKRKHLFTKKLNQDFDATFGHIYEDSPQNAKKFAKELDNKIEKIKERPTAFPTEPAMPTQKNWYRFALLMKHYKVIYKLTNDLLIFLGIIHTSRHRSHVKKLRTNKYQ